MNPVNKVIVQRIDSDATGSATMVFTIRETMAEHNVVVELLRKIRHQYPGPWWQFMSELAKNPVSGWEAETGTAVYKNSAPTEPEEKVKPIILATEPDEERAGVAPV